MSQTKRVTLSATSSTPSRRIVQPKARAAAAEPSAAQGCSEPATWRTPSLVLAIARTSAWGICSRTKRAHCAFACGCESTTSISPSSSGSRAIRLWRIGWSYSPTMRTPEVSKASASRVERTEPSIEFSKGTKARPTWPSSTARIASKIVACGASSISAAGVAAAEASSASSL